jgi:hypothetical protein
MTYRLLLAPYPFRALRLGRLRLEWRHDELLWSHFTNAAPRLSRMTRG